jgi:hypothetical protein
LSTIASSSNLISDSELLLNQYFLTTLPCLASGCCQIHLGLEALHHLTRVSGSYFLDNLKGLQHTLAISAAQNGLTRFSDDMTVAEIKTKARETVQKEARGASAMTLIKTARAQYHLAKEYEMNGDLKSALGTFTKAAGLAKMTMDSTEFVAETASGRTGVLRKEFTDFWEVSAQKVGCYTNPL